MDASSRIAVVTGAGTGIGKATAIALADAGYRLVLAGRRAELLHDVAKELGADKEALVVPTDVTKPDSVRKLFESAQQQYGRIDVLFNNAGIYAPAVAFEDLAYEKWSEVVDVNLNGMFLCAQAAFRIMKNQNPRGGRIINNGSISAHAPRPDSVAYTATKHAITGLTKSISLDGRKYDIVCSQIDIGNAMTELLTEGVGLTKGVKQANGALAVEPMMNVKEVAKAVVFMSGLPLEANVQFMTVLASKMPFIGRG